MDASIPFFAFELPICAARNQCQLCNKLKVYSTSYKITEYIKHVVLSSFTADKKISVLARGNGVNAQEKPSQLSRHTDKQKTPSYGGLARGSHLEETWLPSINSLYRACVLTD